MDARPVIVRSRYDIVECVVIRHAPYGVLVELDPEERGWIEGDYVNEARSIDPRTWPPPKSRVIAVVLGTTRDGRVRLASVPSFVERIRSGDVGPDDLRSDQTGTARA
jgi:hypothetical protein